MSMILPVAITIGRESRPSAVAESPTLGCSSGDPLCWGFEAGAFLRHAVCPCDVVKMHYSLPHLIILAVVAMSWVVPLCIIVSRTGRNWAWGLLAIFPLLAIALLWALALMRWPSCRALDDGSLQNPG